MLQRLFVKNIALIDELEIEFSRGFNALTGETGAGKSIIIDAVNLVLGGRADRELIRSGADRSLVVAVFDVGENAGLLEQLRELGYTLEENELHISREILSGGKNACRINSAPATLSSIQTIGDMLMDVHGQHEHQSLLKAQNHINMLDALGRQQIRAAAQTTKELYSQMRAVQKRLLRGFMDETEKARRVDVLSYQISEIQTANPEPGEDERLQSEQRILANGEKIALTLQSAREIISGDERGAIGTLQQLRQAFAALVQFGGEYEEVHQKIEEICFGAEDVAYRVRDLEDAFDFDPQRQSEVEQRLDTLANLKRKYGDTISEILEYCQAAQSELNELTASTQEKAELESRKAELESDYYAAALQLSDLRKKTAAALEVQIMNELAQLGLAKAVFKVHFAPLIQKNETERFGENGLDSLEFMLSANPGEPLKPLSKVASGGEMSRIMLALKTVLAGADGIPSLIFDEIDTGISGNMAATVGEKMLEIAMTHQVLCVTHQPQIAAMAHAHYLIEKNEKNGHAVVSARKLDDAGREAELARIFGDAGNTSLALEHAKSLLDYGRSKRDLPNLRDAH